MTTSPSPGPAEAGAALPRRRGLLRDVAPVVAAAAVFLLVWQLIVAIGDYPHFILPGPAMVAERFVTGWAEGIIGPHFVTTLTEVLLGLAVGGIAGVMTGVLLARSRLAARMLSPYIVAAQATPILALAPLVALWFGTGLLSRTLICALICYFPIAVGTMVGIRSVDPRLLELGRSLRATRWQLLGRIEVPSALPRSWADYASASRWPSLGRSWPSGPAVIVAWVCSSISPAAASSTSRSCSPRSSPSRCLASRSISSS